MRMNYNNIAVVFGLVFVIWIFYRLSSFSSPRPHDHRTTKVHFTDSAISPISKKEFHADYSDIKLKLRKAEQRIRDLTKMLYSKDKSPQKRDMEQSTNEFSGHKVVHLDLKGAPPKMAYLIKLLSYFKKWGATGVLVEYEDMFPYHGDLDIIKTGIAYSTSEITHFLEECENQKLIVIPLIQTFGHLEFVLKHKKFAHLRETKYAANSICPNNKGSVPLIKKLIDQVLELHPNIKYFHVGGDEVFNLKTCPVCLADSRDKTGIFLHHMKPILKYVKSKKLVPLMWDDMMRKWTVNDMKVLKDLMEPMVWGYGHILDNYFPEDMWERYAAAFPKMWGASAFKGASNPDSNFVPINFHLQNNLDWLQVISTLPDTTSIEGIALTGWSRFDHYAALCELLPAALPSVAFCLAALNKGKMDNPLEKSLKKELGLPQSFVLKEKGYPKCNASSPKFPGHEIFTVVCNLTKALYRVNGIKHLETGWMLTRHLKDRFLSYQHVHNAFNYSTQASTILKTLKEEVIEPLSEVYEENIVKEWVTDKIDANLEEAKRRFKELKALEMSFE